MDFHKLFKRKEDAGAHGISADNHKEVFAEREILLSEGDVLDGQTPASLEWKSAGGSVRISADKIQGILEGRTRIKAAVLQELCPALFSTDPPAGTEFIIPLQTIVAQLESTFAGTSSTEPFQDGFDTPFGQLAREDEAKFKDQPEEVQTMAAEGAVSHESLSSEADLKKESNDSVQEPENCHGLSSSSRNVDTVIPGSKNGSPDALSIVRGAESRGTNARRPAPLPAVRPARKEDFRRDGHESLQELFLTDDQLDASKVAELILQLPRVTGTVVMLFDGALLGGGLSGGLTQALLNLTPAFAVDLARFTENMHGGPTKFVTFTGDGCLMSLTVCGDILILASHARKNLPPGLRERFMATANALNMIYGPCRES
jgi:hypothetical protein